MGPVNDRSERASEWSRCRSALIFVRTFLGLVYLSNGVAKLFDVYSVTLGPWKTTLINRSTAFLIQTGNTQSSPGFLHDLGLLVLANWDIFQWLLTAAELGVGIALLLGILSRLTQIGGFLLAFSTFLFSLGAQSWMFDYLFEPALFIALLIGPPLPGLDSRMPWGRSRSAFTAASSQR
jgi:uncharacterized membrane protein YphA (DoxX/SURF4 family)